MNIDYKISMPIEHKFVAENGEFEVYASVFYVKDEHNDIVVPGAFLKSIKKSEKPIVLWQHIAEEPIGRVTHLAEDDYGLFMKGKILQNLQRGREAYELVKSGVIRSLSIGYKVKDSVLDYKNKVRYLQKIDLIEISFVTFPANNRSLVTSLKAESEASYLYLILIRAHRALDGLRL